MDIWIEDINMYAILFADDQHDDAKHDIQD